MSRLLTSASLYSKVLLQTALGLLTWDLLIGWLPKWLKCSLQHPSLTFGLLVVWLWNCSQESLLILILLPCRRFSIFVLTKWFRSRILTKISRPIACRSSTNASRRIQKNGNQQLNYYNIPGSQTKPHKEKRLFLYRSGWKEQIFSYT